MNYEMHGSLYVNARVKSRVNLSLNSSCNFIHTQIVLSFLNDEITKYLSFENNKY